MSVQLEGIEELRRLSMWATRFKEPYDDDFSKLDEIYFPTFIKCKPFNDLVDRYMKHVKDLHVEWEQNQTRSKLG